MINQGRLQEIINAKKLLEDEGYQSPRLKPTQNQLDQENGLFMEIVDELATQITEMNYGADTFIEVKVFEGNHEMKFSPQAQDYYNDKYDEVENLINQYLKH